MQKVKLPFLLFSHFLRFVFFLAVASPASYGQWVPVADYPGGPEDAAVSFTIGNTGYIAGGFSNNDLWAYSPDTDSWTQMADIGGTGFRGFSFGFSIGDKGYIGGGDTNGGNPGGLTDDFWEYDSNTDVWTQKADFPGGVRDATIKFALGGKGYVGGGFDGIGGRNDFYVYDPGTDSWSQLDNYPGGPIIDPVAFVIGDKAYVGTGDGSPEKNDLWEFDPQTETWTQKADFPGLARQSAVAFSINGKGYIGSGHSQYTDGYSDFWEYDPLADTWTELPHQFPIEIAFASAFVIGPRAYVGLGLDFAPPFPLVNKFYLYSFDEPSNAHDLYEPSAIYIYPNPATEKIWAAPKNTQIDILKIEVLNWSGISIIENKINSATPISIDIADLSKGYYQINFHLKKGSIVSEKFLKL